MLRIKHLINNHRYSLIIFSGIVIYNFAVTNAFNLWTISKSNYAYHLVDFSVGFCSKLLPGAVYNFFFDDTSMEAISIYCSVLMLTAFALISLLCERLLIKFGKENTGILSFLLVFFFTGTSTFPMYITKLGALDMYWLIFAIISVICLSDKRLYIFIIPANILSVSVNFGSIISFIPFIILLMLYKISITDKKDEKIYLWLTAVMTALFCVAVALYFIMFEKNNINYTFSEFSELLASRGFKGRSIYYATSLYSEPLYDSIDYEQLNSEQPPLQYFFVYLCNRIRMTLDKTSITDGLAPFFLMLPILLFTVSFFIKRIKNCKKLNKLVYICFPLMFIATNCVGMLFSTDVIRTLGHAYTLLFASFLFVSYYEKDDAVGHIHKTVKSISMAAAVIYALIYSASTFDPQGLFQI